ncbi:MAG: hypothetical protein CM1200mP30_11200 [Pseudomonadota bacterium]|nr:MAG: hypothetical protein CM1200mP30_11200 [Pseudomonadota bacterium]
MQYKLSDFIERNTDVPEVNSALKSIKKQMENIGKSFVQSAI